MLGRGIDQRMPQHCDPAPEERRCGPASQPFAASSPWGDALAWMEGYAAEHRIVNLETAITTASVGWPGKAVHFRTHPANVATLKAGAIDACTLANNHSLDYGYNGLSDTLRSLRQAGIATAGAGHAPHQAQAPAVMPMAGGGRVLLFAWAFTSSGVPPEWATRGNRPGIALLSGIDGGTVKWLARCIQRQRQPGDRVVVSLHWGGNWVPVIPEQHRWLARHLIDSAQVDVVYGHSSHHPLPQELYRGRLILYGCGDLLNDYEGLPPHAPWRSDLVCLYGLELDRHSGQLLSLELQPFTIHGLQLRPIAEADRTLLEHQMALESLTPQWRCHRQGHGWLLLPSGGTSAANPQHSAEMPHHGP